MGSGRPVYAMGAGRLPMAALVALVALSAAGAVAAEPSRADIQWAQTVLKERGFDAGPARGEMNERTRAALGSFQKRNGLPVTGRLDAATTAALMAGREPAPTMGNLAAPKPAAGASRPVPAPTLAPAKPRAAPTVGVERGGVERGGVETGGEASGGILDAVRRSDGGAPAPGEPAPEAAPRMAVAAEGGDGVAPVAGTRAGGFDPGSLMVPAWVRSAIYAVAGLLVLVLALAWWLSGRRPRRAVPHGAGMGERVAPTLGPVRREGELRADLRPSRGGYGR